MPVVSPVVASINITHIVQKDNQIGRPHEVAHGSLRLSLSADNTEEEVEEILRAVPEVVDYLRNMSPLWKDKVNGRKEFVI